MTGTVAGGDGPAGTKHERLNGVSPDSQNQTANKQKIFIARAVSSLGQKKHAPRRRFLGGKKSNGQEKRAGLAGIAKPAALCCFLLQRPVLSLIDFRIRKQKRSRPFMQPEQGDKNAKRRR